MALFALFFSILLSRSSYSPIHSVSPSMLNGFLVPRASRIFSHDQVPCESQDINQIDWLGVFARGSWADPQIIESPGVGLK